MRATASVCDVLLIIVSLWAHSSHCVHLIYLDLRHFERGEEGEGNKEEEDVFEQMRAPNYVRVIAIHSVR